MIINNYFMYCNFWYILVALLPFLMCKVDTGNVCISSVCEDDVNAKMIFYFCEENFDECSYLLCSSCIDFYGDHILFKFDGSKAFVDFLGEGTPNVLFSFQDTIGSSRKIEIRQYTWGGAGRSEFPELRNYTVRLIRKVEIGKENIAFLQIEYISIPFLGEVCHHPGFLGVVVFSSERGFIGSYYVDPNNPLEIIQKEGDVLEDVIDYSSYSFYEFM